MTDENTVNQKIERLSNKLDRIDERLRGNGQDGLTTRIDRIERWMSSRIWFERLMIGSAIITVGAVVVALIK